MSAEELWAPVTVTAAGYGAAKRQLYITESSQDPEYAACVWDEEIVPGAEASGEIPTRPVEPVSPVEQARQVARQEAMRTYWEQNPVEQGGYDPLSNTNEPGAEDRFNTVVDQISTQIMQDNEPEIEI